MRMKKTVSSVFAALAAFAAAGIFTSGCVSPVRQAGEALKNSSWEDAVVVCDGAIRDGRETSNPDLYVFRAQALWRLNRIPEAEADLDKALTLGLNNGRYHILKAQIRMFECRYRQAADESLLAVNAMPDSELPKKMYRSALARENAVRTGQARLEAALAKAQNAANRDRIAFALAGLLYCSTEDGPRKAISFLNAPGLKDLPAASDALAWFLLQSWDPAVRDPAAALAIARRNAEKAPENPVALDTLASAEAANGNFDAAQKALVKSRRIVSRLPVRRKELLPYLKQDSETRLKAFQTKKYQPERRGAIRLIWLVFD